MAQYPCRKGLWKFLENWILSYDVIPAVSLWLPAYDTLEIMTELTKHDCDHACKDESSKRALTFKAKIHIDIHDGYSKMSYKLIRSKDSQPLSEVPKKYPSQATPCQNWPYGPADFG